MPLRTPMVSVDRLISRMVIAALTIAYLNGCSLKDTADHMRDSTDQLKDISEGIGGKSQHLAKRTDDLEAELSKKESYAMIRDSILQVFGESANHETANNMNPEPDMLLWSGAAVESMHFQFWKGDYNEDINELDIRFKFSAEVLFVETLKHVPRDFNVNPFGDPSRSYQGVASLGAKLDRVTDRYAANLAKRKLTSISLYDVIVTALQNRAATERHELLPKASAMILQYRREAIYMLQLRHNYLPMMVLSRMTDFADRNLLERVWLMLGLSSAGHIDLNKRGDSFEAEELKEWTDWLNHALITRQALRDMGIAPIYNATFVKLLGRLDFHQKQILEAAEASPHIALTPKQQLEVNFARAFTQVVDESTPPPPPFNPNWIHEQDGSF